MTSHTIGILHPGDMGISIAASAVNNGHTVYWVSEGRSEASRARAEKHGLQDAGTLAALCAQCDIILSVCPPHAAEDVARQVLNQNFKGLYLDANAINPQKAIRIGELLSKTGATLIDGGIIGGPAWKPNSTFLYLSGSNAQTIADCFAKGPLETRILSDKLGDASALKMCYAAYTKGTTALLCAVLGAAEQLGVREALYSQWAQENAASVEQNNQRVRTVTAKAWRFAGEMEEIAATFASAEIPDGFHLAAEEIYSRMAGFKDAGETPALEEVLGTLIKPTNKI